MINTGRVTYKLKASFEIRNKEGLIKTDMADGSIQYLTDEEYAIELVRRKTR